MQNYFTKKEILKKYSGYEIVYLGIGQVFFSKKPVLVHTILGSCLAVAFYNDKQKIGSICHAQTPTKLSQEKCFKACPLKCLDELPKNNLNKYVSCSIKYMLNEFKKSMIGYNDVVAKVIGGAKVLEMIQSNGEKKTVGEENIITARHFIKNYKIRINAEDVGGENGRVIYYFTGDNSLYMTKINDPDYGKFKLI